MLYWQPCCSETACAVQRVLAAGVGVLLLALWVYRASSLTQMRRWLVLPLRRSRRSASFCSTVPLASRVQRDRTCRTDPVIAYPRRCGRLARVAYGDPTGGQHARFTVAQRRKPSRSTHFGFGVFGLIALLVGCAGPTVTLIPDAPSDTITISGLQHIAGLAEVGNTLVGTVTVVNTADTVVTYPVGGGCPLTLVFRPPGETNGSPVFDSSEGIWTDGQFLDRLCTMDRMLVKLAPGARRDFMEHVPHAALLETLRSSGQYRVWARLDTQRHGAGPLLLRAGSVEVWQ